MANDIEPFFEETHDGKVLDPKPHGLLMPMGDGPYPRRIWEPWRHGIEAAPGISLGTDDHTEIFARLSGYLRNAEVNARRLCACWNAFLGVPLEEIEAIALKRNGWQPPPRDAMWTRHDTPMRRAKEVALAPVSIETTDKDST